MRGLNTQVMLLTITLLCTSACIVKNELGQGRFIALPAGTQVKIKLLMPHIFKQQWQIGYRYGADCKPADRQNGKELKDAISAALRVWLAPLKELPPAQAIVDKFVYELQADLNPDQPEDLNDRRAVDLQVTFECTQGASLAQIGLLFPPAIVMRRGTKITPDILDTLTHEVGHAFGLADTYARQGLMRSRGGLRSTTGKQPASVMAASGHIHDNKNMLPAISEDDKRGILWLYRFFHEKQAVDSCFFADYVYVKIEHVGTCVPKHPLIFEVKHNPTRYALQILKDDPDLDINAQDVGGMSALHYAVLYEKLDVVRALLAHEDIKPLLKNKQGETPLDIAQAIKNNAIVDMFPKDKPNEPIKPPSLDVAPKNKVITTWGAIKKE